MEKNYQYVSPKAKSILLHYERPILEGSNDYDEGEGHNEGGQTFDE